MNVIIVGGGQVGGYIAGLLIENGNNAIVIENKEKALQALKKNGLKRKCPDRRWNGRSVAGKSRSAQM